MEHGKSKRYVKRKRQAIICPLPQDRGLVAAPLSSAGTGWASRPQWMPSWQDDSTSAMATEAKAEGGRTPIANRTGISRASATVTGGNSTGGNRKWGREAGRNGHPNGAWMTGKSVWARDSWRGSTERRRVGRTGIGAGPWTGISSSRNTTIPDTA